MDEGDLAQVFFTDFRRHSRQHLTKSHHALKSTLLASHGGLAQLVERLVRNEKARGSNPLTSTSRPTRLGLASVFADFSIPEKQHRPDRKKRQSPSGEK